MFSLTGLHPKTRYRLQAVGFVALIVLVSGLYVSLAWAYQSDHAQLTLVWNGGQEDCADLPMTLVDDHLWECTVPVQAGVTYYCQFWTGEVDDPKYGADLFDPSGLVLDIDPSSVVMSASSPGYRILRVDESAPAFNVQLAPGRIVLVVQLSDDAPQPPTDLAASVADLSSGRTLGDYLPSSDDPFALTGLLPGRTYSITVTATGYGTEVFEVNVPDEAPVTYALVLQRNVAAEHASWSAVKAIYQR
jgi:hypothetical protein